MGKGLWFLSLLFLGWLGFQAGRPSLLPEKKPLAAIEIREKKPFVFVVSMHNGSDRCEKVLYSLFTQNYENYRLIFIDDGSIDSTFEIAQKYIEQSRQEGRSTLIREEKQRGEGYWLASVAEGLIDEEVVIPLTGGDWLAHPGVLSELNALYQDPNVWALFADALTYPSYKELDGKFQSFYGSVLKELGQASVCKKSFDKDKTLVLNKPLVFSNDSF